MSTTLRGIAAAPGIAVAPAWRYEPQPADRVRDELGLDDAIAAATAQLNGLVERLTAAGRPAEAGILEAQIMMANDPELVAETRRRMSAGEPTSTAVSRAGGAAAAQLAALDDELLSARAADVRDVVARVARSARGEVGPQLARRSIVVAEDLPPSVTAELDSALLAGVVLGGGSRTAHAAILSRALGIPAVVGVEGVPAAIPDGVALAIDGERGEVVLEPDASDLVGLERRRYASEARLIVDRELSGQPLRTRDGHRITLAANIGHPEEAAAALAAGAEAIGLFRTEFLFMGRPSAPGEEVQAAAYASVLELMGERPVVIRLLDVGGDKAIGYLNLPAEANPFLGMRAIRLARRNPELILAQLRAILRAGERTGRQPWIMAPMIGDLQDVALFRELASRAVEQSPGAPHPRLGVMIEIPSAAVLGESLAREVDFFSIGTNDLTQYALAVDRTNPELGPWQDPLHPGVTRLIQLAAKAAAGAGIPVAVCGEMAGDPAGSAVLIGLGVDELSMGAASFPEVKRAVGAVDHQRLRELARDCLAAPGARQARDAADSVLRGGPAA